LHTVSGPGGNIASQSIHSLDGVGADALSHGTDLKCTACSGSLRRGPGAAYHEPLCVELEGSVNAGPDGDATCGASIAGGAVDSGCD
jgi:hypothetical protein